MRHTNKNTMEHVILVTKKPTAHLITPGIHAKLQLKNMATLSIRSGTLDATNYHLLADILRTKPITALRMSQVTMGFLTQSMLLRDIMAMDHLSELEFSFILLDNTNLYHTIVNHPQLSKLSLRHMDLRFEDLDQLADALTLSRIDHLSLYLDISYNPLLVKLPSIGLITLELSDVSRDDLPLIVEAVKDHPTLKNLKLVLQHDVSPQDLDDAHFERCVSIRHLSLYDTSCNDIFYRGFETSRQIEQLDVGGLEATNERLISICRHNRINRERREAILMAFLRPHVR